MSRIGNKPVQIPAGVEVAVNGNNVVVKGPKGQLELDIYEKLAINVEDNVLPVSRPDDERETRARHGLTRALIHNMVVGVSEGYTVRQELVGVGYRVEVAGQMAVFALGFSHEIHFQLPAEIKAEAEPVKKGQNPVLVLKSCDKQLIGQVAAKIRSFRKPEPYKGKGIKFVGETLRRKAGKSAGAK